MDIDREKILDALIEKTRQGKVHWVLHESAAALPTAMLPSVRKMWAQRSQIYTVEISADGGARLILILRIDMTPRLVGSLVGGGSSVQEVSLSIKQDDTGSEHIIIAETSRLGKKLGELRAAVEATVPSTEILAAIQGA